MSDHHHRDIKLKISQFRKAANAKRKQALESKSLEQSAALLIEAAALEALADELAAQK